MNICEVTHRRKANRRETPIDRLSAAVSDARSNIFREPNTAGVVRVCQLLVSTFCRRRKTATRRRRALLEVEVRGIKWIENVLQRSVSDRGGRQRPIGATTRRMPGGRRAATAGTGQSRTQMPRRGWGWSHEEARTDRSLTTTDPRDRQLLSCTVAVCYRVTSSSAIWVTPSFTYSPSSSVRTELPCGKNDLQLIAGRVVLCWTRSSPLEIVNFRFVEEET